MNEQRSIVIAWISVALQFIAHYFSACLSLTAVALAIGASFYALRVNRAKWLYLSAKGEHACEECITRGAPSQCPFPNRYRPPTCPHRKPRRKWLWPKKG